MSIADIRSLAARLAAALPELDVGLVDTPRGETLISVAADLDPVAAAALADRLAPAVTRVSAFCPGCECWVRFEHGRLVTHRNLVGYGRCSGSDITLEEAQVRLRVLSSGGRSQ